MGIGVNKRISVRDALLELSKIYAIEVGDRMIIFEIPKRTRTLAETLGLELELFPKIVRS
mgnify:CR=1 FL=1